MFMFMLMFMFIKVYHKGLKVKKGIFAQNKKKNFNPSNLR